MIAQFGKSHLQWLIEHKDKIMGIISWFLAPLAKGQQAARYCHSVVSIVCPSVHPSIHSSVRASVIYFPLKNFNSETMTGFLPNFAGMLLRS